MKENMLVVTLIKTAILGFIFILITATGYTQKEASAKSTQKSIQKSQRIFYGLASFYANKFHGRQTANGEIFNNEKLTAACNVLPLGTWIQVTNLKNGKKVIVKTTDRLHPKMRRLVDLSRAAAKKLGYISRGLTRVKVVVLNQKVYK